MRLVDVDALARYIEADWRVRKKSRTVYSMMDDAQDFTFQRCLTLIERMPIIDAQPVKQGKWKRNADGELYCSYCMYNPKWDADKFCAGCGARMDGDANADS